MNRVRTVTFQLLIAFVLGSAFTTTTFAQTSSPSPAATPAAQPANPFAPQPAPPLPAGMTGSGVVTCAAGDTNSNASVTVTSSYTFSIPFIPLGTKTITAKGTMRCGG